MKHAALILSALLSTLALPVQAVDYQFGPFSVPSSGVIDAVTQVEGTTWDLYVHGCLDGTTYNIPPYTLADLLVSPIQYLVDLGAADLPSDMVFEARFTDNLLVNGPGVDLILFDAAVEGPSGYDVAIESESGFTDFRSYPPNVAVDLGREEVYWWSDWPSLTLVRVELHATAIDLSDFGFSEGIAVTAFRFKGHAGADPLGAAAIHTTANTVPTHATSWGAVKALYR